MKKSARIVLAILLFLCTLVFVFSKKSSPSEKTPDFEEIAKIIPTSSKEFSDVTQDYSYPKISPDGKKLLISKINSKGIYWLDLKSNALHTVHENVNGFNASWSKDSKAIYYNTKNKDYSLSVKKTAIDTNITETINASGNLILSTIEDEKQFSLDRKTLILSIYDTATGIKKTITPPQNKTFYFPLISPNKKHFVIHSEAEMLLYNTEGTFVKSLGNGIATDWSNDSNIILFFRDTSVDGHEISGSEIYTYNIKNQKTSQRTFTENRVELYPHFKDNNHVYYHDANKGNIEILSLN